jgi:hypothetical protein
MPKLYVYDTDRKITTNFTVAFARGAIKCNNENNGPWEVKHLPIKHYLQNGLPGDLLPGVDAVATLGILRGTGLMLKEAKAKGIDYYYMDHAYFKPGYNGKGWMRIVKNGHSCTILKDVGAERWKGFHKNAGYEKQPWRTNAERGSAIVICPPTDAVQWFFGDCRNWEENVVSDLKRMLPPNEHSRIVVRRKPKEPVVDDKGNLIELRQYSQNGTLEQALADAHCVIAYNSMVALEATLKGIPVITSANSCCARVSFGLEDFKDSTMPAVFNTEPLNRQALLNWLACNQWKMREIEEGTAWHMLQENYNGVV